ncbi:DEKNAAC100418 [Brettanomyces naardenensis]|uniref:DEKNAAC100419 n=1 Tax=Brettanomyces naardenensis TaxID=13370 RepID=A0A448YEE5_BRENA|nr:DEKNAAC100418 [Brettanomyces naardenensis]
MSLQTYSQNVTLKVLYTFDDNTTFLDQDVSPIGCIDLRKCLSLVSSTSPEWFQKDSEYSIYSKDVVEPGEPFVAYGLWSKLKDRRNAVIITGRLCKNFVSLYSGGSAADTLEVRLRYSALKQPSNSHTMGSSLNASNQSLASNSSASRKRINDSDNSSPNPIQDDARFQEPQQPLSKRRRSGSSRQLLHNKPLLATRTQSMPFVSEHSLAHRILISDMQEEQSSSPTEELDARGDPISLRFSNYEKLMKQNAAPTRAKRSRSFIKSVVKIGDVSTVQKSHPKEQPVQKCVNCASTFNPPYKFHRDGIYQFANAGLLCHPCHELQQKSDIDGLRRRGELGAQGLLDVPYSKSTAKYSKKRVNGRSRKAVMDSSPAFYSSPMYPEGSSRRISSVQNNIIPEESQTDSDDLPGRSSYQNNMLTDIDPVYRPKDEKQREKQLHNKIREEQASSVFSDSTDTVEEDDDSPLNATKLNTTLIPLDDEDKENIPPAAEQKHTEIPEQQAAHSLLGTEISPSIQRIIESFSNTEPVNASPSKNSPTGEWVNSFFNFFQQEGDEDADNGVAESQLDIAGETIDDPEVSRVLSKNAEESKSKGSSPFTNIRLEKTPRDRFEATPVDANADTVPTQSDPDGTPGSVFNQLLEAAKQPIAGIPVNISERARKQSQPMAMPSSPYFVNPDDSSSKSDSREVDTSRTEQLGSATSWEPTSSPVTEPSSTAMKPTK